MITKLSRNISFFLFLFILSTSLFAQVKNQKPKLNQIGFYPTSSKIAITPQTGSTSFYLRNTETNAIVFEGNLSSAKSFSPTGESVKSADFSSFVIPGKYVLGIDGGEESFEFEIGNNILADLSDGVLKAFYYNRASTALPEEYAGVWNRDLGHPDTTVLIHNSAATANRPANSTISSPKGWYDAGDFNKYVVPISSSISQLLFAYEEFPDYFANQNLNIPESGNGIPDILNESLWALRWLFTMQDPDDGGVYHKLTTSNFVGTVMPSGTNATRYVVMKGTGATFDFAAVMAQAARVYEPFLPDFADSALAAAELAYTWGESNPNISYNQGSLNNPTISTGAYGDGNFADEKYWAASELYITTSNDDYYISGGWSGAGVVGWNSVRALGLYSLVQNRKNLTAVGLSDTTTMKLLAVNIANSYLTQGNNSAYKSPFGFSSGHYFWGSNGFAGNIGLSMLYAYQITGEQKYYNSSIDVVDYIMGRNGLDYSYVTGFGDQPPMNIHHRQSEADGIIDPVPGWVAGGANPGNQNQDCGASAYNSSFPALSFLDHYCSYSTNEITTYWNSPFVFLLAGLETVTPEFSLENTKILYFTEPDFQLVYEPGDTVSIAWSLFNVDNIDLSYKLASEEEFTDLALDVAATDSIFEGFIIPDMPGDSIVFRIVDSGDPTAFAKSVFLKIKPPKSIELISFDTATDFSPQKRITFRWSSKSVNLIDIYYRFHYQEEFTLIKEDIEASKGSYNGFRVPDAPGDSVIFRLQDSEADTVFIDSAPRLIASSVSNEVDDDLVNKFELTQNYPNPFNPSTKIRFSLAEPGFTTLSVYDTNGRLVSSLVNEYKSVGSHSVNFDASGLSSGVYIYTLTSEYSSDTKKMLLIK